MAQVETSLQKVESKVRQQLQSTLNVDRSKLTAIEQSFENSKEKLTGWNVGKLLKVKKPYFIVLLLPSLIDAPLE